MSNAVRPVPSGEEATVHRCVSEKVTALSAIGSGFAHEIGNPIAGALALLQLASRRTREPETREYLAGAHDELTRVAQIIHELADFTRQDGGTAIIDVNEVLRAALTLARYAHQGARMTVVFEPDRHLLPLVGGRNSLLDVFLHLVLHAYESVSGDEGRLQVVSEARGEEILVLFEETSGGARSTVRLPIRPKQRRDHCNTLA